MENKDSIIWREKKIKVRDLMITFNEEVKIDNITGEEVYDREIEIGNTSRLYDIYKAQKNMNTIEDIISIREKYELSQSDYSLVLGLGKVTIHRYENGMLQTEANDSIITLSKDIKNMHKLIEMNRGKIEQETYEKLYNKILELEKLEKHRILEKIPSYLEKNKFETTSVFNVVKKILWISEEITPLSLQKILYYIQGVSLSLYDKKAFNEKIINWEYGPVIEEVYHKFKNNVNCAIPKEEDIILSEGLDEIIKEVTRSYGQFSAPKLVELTHGEEPWQNTKRNEEITKESLSKYFKKLYC